MAREKKDLVVTSFNIERKTKEELLNRIWQEKTSLTEFLNNAIHKYLKQKRKEDDRKGI